MNNINVDINVDGEILNVEAIETNPQNNYFNKKVMNNKNNSNIVNEIRETEGWRSKFFNKELCEGIIENTGDGNITITGKLKIDKQSANLLKGSEIDYVKELIGESFKINNPQTKSSCGCGVSFSL